MSNVRRFNEIFKTESGDQYNIRLDYDRTSDSKFNALLRAESMGTSTNRLYVLKLNGSTIGNSYGSTTCNPFGSNETLDSINILICGLKRYDHYNLFVKKIFKTVTKN